MRLLTRASSPSYLCSLQAHYRDYGQMTYARAIFVIHNMAHQGRGPFVETENLELNEAYREQFRLYDPIGGEHMNIMKAGLQNAHRLIAVSGGFRRAGCSGGTGGFEGWTEQDEGRSHCRLQWQQLSVMNFCLGWNVFVCNGFSLLLMLGVEVGASAGGDAMPTKVDVSAVAIASPWQRKCVAYCLGC